MNIFKQTADGSLTLYNEEIGEHYHSAHGALQESKHVFLEAGLKDYHKLSSQNQLNSRTQLISEPQLNNQTHYSILEMGFGTGLNFLLSASYALDSKIKLNYTGIEAFPLTLDQIKQTAYHQYLDSNLWNTFIEQYQSCIIKPENLSNVIHDSPNQSISDHSFIRSSFNTYSTKAIEIQENINLQIWHDKLQNMKFIPIYDIIYFDAFSVRHQPELWSQEIIANICSALLPGGLFVSYAITGNLKRALQAAGLRTEKYPGPPGKREMIRAFKPIN